MFRIHKSTENSSADPLIDQDQGAIRGQINEWFQTLESGKVALWIFDASFHQLYESEGYEFVNNLLTKTRHALKRSEKSRGVTSPMRCVGDKQPDQWRRRSPQTLRKIDAGTRQKRLHAKQDKIRLQERTARGARLPQVGAA